MGVVEDAEVHVVLGGWQGGWHQYRVVNIREIIQMHSHDGHCLCPWHTLGEIMHHLSLRTDITG